MKTEPIWYEKNWTTNHNFLFQKSTKINPGIHFIIPYPSLLSSELKVDVCLKEDFSNCHPCFICIGKIENLGYAWAISNKPDTLVLLFGTNYGSGYQDTITYVRE